MTPRDGARKRESLPLSLLEGKKMPEAATYLRLAQNELRLSREHRLQSAHLLLESFLLDLERPAKNIATARKIDPTANFTDDHGEIQTCDTLTCDLLDMQATAYGATAWHKYSENSKTHYGIFKSSSIASHRRNEVATLEKLVTYKPYSSAAYVRLAEAYIWLNDGANAARVIDEGMRVFPEDIDLLRLKNDNNSSTKPDGPLKLFAKDRLLYRMFKRD